MFLTEPAGTAEALFFSPAYGILKGQRIVGMDCDKGWETKSSSGAPGSWELRWLALPTALDRFRDIIQNSYDPLIQGADGPCTKQVVDTHLWLFVLTEQEGCGPCCCG